MGLTKYLFSYFIVLILPILMIGCHRNNDNLVTLEKGDIYLLYDDANTIYRFLRIEDDDKYKSVYALNDLSNYTEKEYVIPDFINGIPVTIVSSEKNYNSANLKSIVFGNNVRYLGTINIDSLESIQIGPNVTLIMSPTFYQCNNLTKVNVDEKNNIYYSENNAIIEIATKTIIAVCNGTTAVPLTATTIGKYSFTGIDMSSIVVTSNITKIEEGAFQQCRQLDSIYIPVSVESIESNIFIDYEYHHISVFCEAPSKPDGWADDWYYIVSKGWNGEHDDDYYKEQNDSLITIHWGSTIEDYYEFIGTKGLVQ